MLELNSALYVQCSRDVHAGQDPQQLPEPGVHQGAADHPDHVGGLVLHPCGSVWPFVR